MSDSEQTSTCCGRRTVLSTSGVLASAAVLGACSSAGQRASDAATRNREAAEAASQAAAQVEGTPVASTGDVPVGGGVIVAGRQTVVTQSTAGDFRAFSSICPHEGCPVTQIEGEQIICPCHDSRFDLASGAVLSGPARTGLTEMTVTVDGEDISVS